MALKSTERYLLQPDREGLHTRGDYDPIAWVNIPKLVHDIKEGYHTLEFVKASSPDFFFDKFRISCRVTRSIFQNPSEVGSQNGACSDD